MVCSFGSFTFTWISENVPFISATFLSSTFVQLVSAQSCCECRVRCRSFSTLDLSPVFVWAKFLSMIQYAQFCYNSNALSDLWIFHSDNAFVLYHLHGWMLCCCPNNILTDSRGSFWHLSVCCHFCKQLFSDYYQMSFFSVVHCSMSCHQWSKCAICDWTSLTEAAPSRITADFRMHSNRSAVWTWRSHQIALVSTDLPAFPCRVLRIAVFQSLVTPHDDLSVRKF